MGGGLQPRYRPGPANPLSPSRPLGVVMPHGFVFKTMGSLRPQNDSLPLSLPW